MSRGGQRTQRDVSVEQKEVIFGERRLKGRATNKDVE